MLNVTLIGATLPWLIATDKVPLPAESSKTSLSPVINVVCNPEGWSVQAFVASQSACVPFQKGVWPVT